MLLPQERIPWILRFSVFRRDVLFRVADGKPSVYLTFDDGPIPESTPWLLETLAAYDAKATFFMVADNARRYPDLFRRVLAEGHAIGNHTFHHRPPFRQTVKELLADIRLAAETFSSLNPQSSIPNTQSSILDPQSPILNPQSSILDPQSSIPNPQSSIPNPQYSIPNPQYSILNTQYSRLFRPPHGLILPHQQKALQKAGYRIVMFDLNTLDYRPDRTPEQILASVKANVRPGCIINLHDSLKSIAKLKQCLPHILSFLKENGYALKVLPDR